MNVKVFGSFFIIAGIIFILWGFSGCMNHGAAMGPSWRRQANEEAGNRNSLIGAGLVFLGIALRVSGRNALKDKNSSSNSIPENLTRWVCQCGRHNILEDGFCPSCGNPKTDSDWKCECGYISNGSAKHCGKCGKPHSQKS